MTISLDMQGIVQGSRMTAYDNLKHEVITRESRHPRQRWVKVVTMVTTLHFWNKKPEPSPQSRLDFETTDVSMDDFWAEVDTEICPIPLVETSFEMTEIMSLSMEPETGFEMTE